MEKELSQTTAPHSVLDTESPKQKEMPHQVRHEDLKPETGDSPMKPETICAADLPTAVRAFWDSAPAPFKVPAILTAIDCYCALATRLRFKYTYDLDPHALLLQVLVVAEVCE